MSIALYISMKASKKININTKENTKHADNTSMLSNSNLLRGQQMRVKDKQIIDLMSSIGINEKSIEIATKKIRASKQAARNKKAYDIQEQDFNSYPDKVKPVKKPVTIHYKFQDKQNSKLGKIAHFSTNLSTCAQNCSYCYAKKAINMYKNTKLNYDNNTKTLQDTKELPTVPKNRDVIRFYVAGDFDSIDTIKAWYRLCKLPENRNKVFFGYTKAWTNKKLLPFLKIFKSLNNVVLRASVDKQTGYDVPKSWAIAGINEQASRDHAKKVYVCKFEKNKIKCIDCKICFSKKLTGYSIFFNQH